MIKLINEEDIPSIKPRTIFFDANILISLFFLTNPNDHTYKGYSRIFNKLLNQGNKLAIDVIVVSEVVNRALRMEYHNYLSKYNIDRNKEPFKYFRNKKEGKDAINRTRTMMCDVILPQFNIIEKKWGKFELEDLLTRDGDFNDQLIANLCKENSYILLTDDADFIDSDTEILSLNKNYA
ncbi:MAG: PIN domain-containing protein [Dysgonamonadaceae bacterium]